MSVIAATAIDNDDELQMDKRTWETLKRVDVDENPGVVPEDSTSEEEDNLVEKRFKFHTDGGIDKMAANPNEDSDSVSEDERITRIDKMAMEIDDSMAQEKVYKMMVDKKEVKRSAKAKAAIELQRTKKMDLDEDELLENEDI